MRVPVPVLLVLLVCAAWTAADLLARADLALHAWVQRRRQRVRVRRAISVRRATAPLTEPERAALLEGFIAATEAHDRARLAAGGAH